MGNLVTIKVQVQNRFHTLADSAVTLTLKKQGTTQPIIAPMVRKALGVYEYDFDTTGKIGAWDYYVYSTGSVQSAASGSFVVVNAPALV